MNSICQALSHTPYFKEYYLSNTYEKALNKKNPLGTQGKLSEAWAALLLDIWRGDRTILAPRTFKAAVGRADAAYVGFDQHDAQEFLGFVLVEGVWLTYRTGCMRILSPLSRQKPKVRNPIRLLRLQLPYGKPGNFTSPRILHTSSKTFTEC